MSFRLFIYYCAISGGWAAFLGWGLGQALGAAVPESWGAEAHALFRALIQGLCLGATVACALGFVDVLWTLGGRQMSQALLKGMVVATIGLVGGLIGAGVSQAVYRITNLEFLTIFGWALTGLLIGASVGLYDVWIRLLRRENMSGSLRKILNGVLGGSVGGLCGSLLYWAMRLGLSGVFGALGSLFHSSKSPDEFKSTSAWGFVALGICIGLFIGLAQVILKEAWVRVEAGFRPGRELVLSKSEITIGRAEGCDIGLFGDNGVERNHASIVLKGNRYLLADANTPGGTYVNDKRVTGPATLQSGDLIRIGKSLLRFGERQKKQ